MGAFVVSAWIREYWPMIVIVVVAVLLIVAGAYGSAQRHDRLIAECAKDHKVYECEIMLKGVK